MLKQKGQRERKTHTEADVTRVNPAILDGRPIKRLRQKPKIK